MAMGVILTVYAFVPPIFFIFAVLRIGIKDYTAEMRALLFANHKLYMWSWYLLIAMGLLLITPQVAVWIAVDKDNPKPDQATFYKYWM